MSQTSKVEAISRTRIGDDVLNLKFRKYDDGWRWEFVETQSAGWIAAESALDTLQEKARLKRVAAWVGTNSLRYEQTVRAMDGYSEYLPRRTDWLFTAAEWQAGRTLGAKMYRTFSPSPERIKKAESLESPQRDAWGNEILLHFDSGRRVAVFISLGADKVKGTPDDVTCVATGRQTFDAFYGKQMWNYTKTWVIPEGLQQALDRAVPEQANRSAQFSRVVD